MKRLSVLIFVFVMPILSFSDTLTAYILVPSYVNTTDIEVVGIAKSNEEKFEETGSIELSDPTINVTLTDVSSTYESYGETKYIEFKVDNGNNGELGSVKFMLGYVDTSGAIDSYTIISSSDMKDNSTIESNVNDNNIEGLDIIDISNLSGYDTYDTFPGMELEDDMRITGFTVGDIEMDTSTLPSNIVDIYYKDGDIGDAVNVVSGGAPINPNASDSNNRFRLYAVKTDSDGNIQYDETGDSIRTLLYANKTKNTDEQPIYGDISDASKGQLYPDDDLTPPYDYYRFDVIVRFKGGNETLDINGEIVRLSEVGFTWEFQNMEEVNLIKSGNNSYYFGFEGDEIIIIPEDPDAEVPPPVGEEIIVIEDSGEFQEGQVDITSKYKESNKVRTTKVKMKVLTESGTTEKNYEIEGIDE